MRLRPNQFTIAVSAIKITAEGAEPCDLQRRRVLELEGDRRSKRGGCRRQRPVGKQRVQADDKSDSDGLSESTRVASVTAPTIPVFAAGRTTFFSTLHFVAPT